ncbi:MAG: hypothetical protein OES38_06875 [Gammaproteobacteria bacterium]|nr:hypothetical protein [Gammaproteobacteria bacterium]
MAFTISTEDSILVVRFDSEPSLEEVKQAVREVDAIADSRFELWDLSWAASADEVKEIAEVAKSKVHRPLRTAILTHTTLSYGLLRMYAVYREQSNNETQVFSDEEAARAWLAEGNDQQR